MRLLLISNSTNAGEPYLQHPKEQIADFLHGINRVLFIPYAAVTFTFDEYESKVQQRFSEFNIEVNSIHRFTHPQKAVHNADAIIVGGGNTFQLLKLMNQSGLLEVIRARVEAGIPYIGWSAGANVACPTIRTTNDMPVAEPPGFGALNLVPFQINPHYLDEHPEGHAGETREQRIMEFLELNPDTYVIGLREGTMLRIENSRNELLGRRPARIFRKGFPAIEKNPGDDIDFLFE
jgi:dipeptidase E